MKNFFYQNQWNWRASGLVLGLVFLLAVALVKPIGVSTQFVILDGIVWDMVSDDVVVEDSDSKSGYASANAYLNKSGGKYAKSITNPLNYGFVFVLAMIAGGFVASRLQSSKKEEDETTSQKDPGESAGKRYLFAFLGGILTLFGARLAGGCTSGHMMSGMMQTSLSGYIFTVSVMTVAVPVSIMMYKKGA